jgi:hypothetical protein
MPKDAPVIRWNDFVRLGKHCFYNYSVALRGDDPAVILYSGGTTGTTKGILLTNKNFNALGQQVIAANPMFNPGDKMLAAMPLFHGFGLGVCIHTMLSQGGRCILVPRFTPKSYAEKLGLSGDDFVYLTSFAHHPYYEEFSIEIPDNWLGEKAINLPLDELLAAMYSAVEQGYTIGLGSDISEYSYGGGICVLPTDENYEKSTLPTDEIVVDEALRLKWFDDRTTVDDHIMHIVGLSKDPQGRRYFKVKDSGGVSRNFDGYCYISESFMRGKVIEIAVNRAAVDPALLARCK